MIYNNKFIEIHIIKKKQLQGFMVQTGDPTGTGKGGQSIWGKNFEDEVRDDLKVNLKNFYYITRFILFSLWRTK